MNDAKVWPGHAWGALLLALALAGLLRRLLPGQDASGLLLAAPLLGGALLAPLLMAAASRLAHRAPALPLPDWSPRRWLLGLVALALAPRVAWVLLADTAPVSDFADYRDLAHQLCARGEYGLHGPSAYRPVGWPAVLAALDCAGLDMRLAGGLLNALLHAATLPPLLLWTARVAGLRAGVLAGALFALWPAQILATPLLATEPLFTALLTWILWLGAELVDHPPSLGAALRLGALAGAAAYVRSTALPLVGVLALAYGARHFRVPGHAWAVLRRHGVALAVALLCLLPWGLRNHQQLGVFSLGSTNEGVTLLLGNSDGAQGGYVPDERLPPKPAGLSEAEVNAWGRQLARQWIASHPARFLALIPHKWAELWGPEFSEASFSMASPPWAPWAGAAAGLSQAWLLAVLAVAAAAWWRRKQPPDPALDPAWAILALWLAIHVVFHGQARFHAPLAPVLCLLVAVGLAQRPRQPQGQEAGANLRPGSATEAAR